MAGGTRFRLWPKLWEGYSGPELVEISRPAGTVGPGPRDQSMYVANAVDKSLPYHPPNLMPPYVGPEFAPAMPDSNGHFDYIAEGTPQFGAAHLYGAVWRVLDIWELLLGHPLVWWHMEDFPRLELVPTLHWGNAHSGAGFLEMGRLWSRNGIPQDLCLNFSVIGHEVGHVILFSVLGAPEEGHLTGAFLAFHEAFADLVSAISTMYFESAIDRLLTQTSGNLYALNLISRIGELSNSDQVRVLDNDVTLSDLGGLRIGRDGSWIDPAGIGRNEHAASAPLSGAIFDCFIELFQDGLVRRKVISPQHDARRWTKAQVTAALAELDAASGAALVRFRTEFGVVVREARDLTGVALARCIQRIDANDLDFGTIAARFCEALVELGQARVLPALIENFHDRDIDPLPLMSRRSMQPAGAASTRSWQHPVWPRYDDPPRPDWIACRGCLAPHAVASANRLIRHPYRGAAELAGL